MAIFKELQMTVTYLKSTSFEMINLTKLHDLRSLSEETNLFFSKYPKNTWNLNIEYKIIKGYLHLIQTIYEILVNK